MLRVQSDDRLIALTRRGNNAAFEVLCGRYQARLLAFCRHMLGSKEDAEDVLQEVFAAAFNAVLADEREINAKPWLYRIARNRSLNHLRRASATGVDSMDVHFAEHGISTSDKVLRRESFNELIGDVHQLPESQRTALLLREIDDLSYEQIALTMETTVPSVKSLLVRARISLADAADARRLSCDDVRVELGEAAEGLGKPSAAARRHTRECERCQNFKRTLKANNKALAALLPVAPALALKNLLLGKLGSTSASHAAGGAGATAGTAASSSVASSGLLTAGVGAVATKAVAGIAAAALVTAGAVAVSPNAPATRTRPSRVPTSATTQPSLAPVRTPTLQTVFHRVPAVGRAALPASAAGAVAAAKVAPDAALPTTAPPAPSTGSQPVVTEETTEQTTLPTSTTEAAAQGASTTSSTAAGSEEGELPGETAGEEAPIETVSSEEAAPGPAEAGIVGSEAGGPETATE